MTKLSSIGSPVIVRRAPHWSDKGVVFANGPFYRWNQGSPGQIAARRDLTAAAIQAYGSTGFVGGIPVVAAAVARATAGRDYGGARNAAMRREQSHQLAQARLSAYSRMAGVGAGGGGAASAALI